MKKILLLFGGESTEHEISILSARNVQASVDKKQFQVALGYISKRGQWRLTSDFDNLENGRELQPILGAGKFAIAGQPDYQPDVIFPVLHGVGGEDGTVQGLAEMLHIPVVGCGVEASAICMDKIATKQILQTAGIKTVPYVVATKTADYNEIAKKLGQVLFVKPPRQGSSVGVSKASNQSEFRAALAEALKYDNVALVEQAIAGRELEVGILGNPPQAKASPVGEIIAGAEFYDYNAKYAADSTSKTAIPADISPEIAQEIQQIASKAFTVLNCAGLARVDFFLRGDEIYLNEVNTLPGFTNISMYPKLWQNSGLSYTELTTKLINLALTP
ncbi:MAG: D-alanine--D-alanine ligase [Candidatus Nomurabacteria bacterium]|jgi:D-alanine-D-alanine ligase|nr:D-alanine--D-alanine ligase [Candidatus Nomurabacteria bacterium]